MVDDQLSQSFQQVACSLEHASHVELKRQTTDALINVVQPIREEIVRLLDDRRCVQRALLRPVPLSNLTPHIRHIQNVLNEVMVHFDLACLFTRVSTF